MKLASAKFGVLYVLSSAVILSAASRQLKSCTSDTSEPKLFGLASSPRNERMSPKSVTRMLHICPVSALSFTSLLSIKSVSSLGSSSLYLMLNVPTLGLDSPVLYNLTSSSSRTAVEGSCSSRYYSMSTISAAVSSSYCSAAIARYSVTSVSS